MLYWWFSTLDKPTMNPIDGRSYSKALLWHPRDHVQCNMLKPGRTSSGAGSVWKLAEFYGAPEPGFVRSSRAGSWTRVPQAFIAPTVDEIGAGNIRLGLRASDGTKVWELVHWWREVPGGVLVGSRLVVGVLVQGSGTAAQRALSAAALRAWAPPGMGYWTAANAWVKHTVEEFGQLEHILPQLYFAANGESPEHIGYNITAAGAYNQVWPPAPPSPPPSG